MASMPNMKALLAVLAVAGYTNRDKIAEMLSGAKDSLAERAAGGANEAAQTSSEISDMFSDKSAGDTVSGGLGELLEQFTSKGEKRTADSWISAGTNQSMQGDSLEQTLGSDTIADIVRKTGFSKDEILERLSVNLPNAVNDFTPNGRIPSAKEAGGLFRKL
jgi:uncharacterized protein YidB (DUF937 family)